MAPEVQDPKKCRKTAKMENCALSQWNRWVATDIHLDNLLACYIKFRSTLKIGPISLYLGM
jgi:hypothetical protein